MIKYQLTVRLLLLSTIILISGCSGYRRANNFALQQQFNKQIVVTSPYNMTSWHKITKPSNHTIRVYVEGDGRAYLDAGTRESSDPTPNSLLLFKAAARDPHPNIIYLPRPCQFAKTDIMNKVCVNNDWTYGRYSQTIVNATNAALDLFKQQYQSQYIELVGFSGGGAIVTLAAASRADISKIITIAGNLDLKAMDEFHQTKPLINSLDPIDIAMQIAHIPQIHFVGTKDNIVPPHVATNFLAASNNSNKIKIITLNSDHVGWLGKTYVE